MKLPLVVGVIRGLRVLDAVDDVVNELTLGWRRLCLVGVVGGPQRLIVVVVGLTPLDVLERVGLLQDPSRLDLPVVVG